MAMLTQSTDPSKKSAIVEAVTPTIHDYNHQDATYGNVFPPTSHFVIHPEWISECVNKRQSQSMERAAWGWEQPKYRQNIKPRTADQAPSFDSKVMQPDQPQPNDIPYKLLIRQKYTPWEITPVTPGTSYYIPAMVPRDEKPECFRRLETEHARLTTTMKERERLQFHLHY